MSLTMEELQEIQADAMADDLEIELERMSLWTKEAATEYFESGGEVDPDKAPAAPAPHPPMPKPSAEDMKKWFPKSSIYAEKPKFRIIAFHNAGSAESVYTGKGMRQKEDNPYVKHCLEKGGALLACELPGREARRTEARSTTLRPYCEALFPVLAPLLQEDVPYAVVGHSMGTWMSYEWLRLCAEKGIPLPQQWIVSGFPAPNIPEADRPWSKNKPMADPAFMDEARAWDVNEIVFQPGNWKTFSPMMRDDFTLFDEYTFTPPPAHLKQGKFPVPMQTYYFVNDKRCKEKHLKLWSNFTDVPEKFVCEQLEGNHLFFYDVPARAAYMEKVISRLPF